MGAALAGVTRTRSPAIIYLFLAAAIGAAWPALHAWPAGGPEQMHPWAGAPRLVYAYFDLLRPVDLTLGALAVFALAGRHAADTEG